MCKRKVQFSLAENVVDKIDTLKQMTGANGSAVISIAVDELLAKMLARGLDQKGETKIDAQV